MKMLEKEPGDAFLLYGVAQEYAKLGQTDKAVEYYDRCLAADPHYCYAYFHKARALQDAGREQEAAAVAREGLNVARRVNDNQAASELAGLLDELE
jgi:Putative Zn-dependent protease, contains TPR repeats